MCNLPSWGALPLRLRLTIWYVLLVAISIGTFSFYLHSQLERRLLEATDATLQVMAAQVQDRVEYEDGRAHFEDDLERTLSASLDRQDFGVRVLNHTTGATVAGFGALDDLPSVAEIRPGYTSRRGRAHLWRVLSQLIRHDAETIGWLEVAASLDTVENTLQTVRDQLLWGIPLVLMLAGSGGFFLAGRALSPISRVTATARRVSATDLSQRLGYTGPRDEVGELAQTFDSMLGRLEEAWIQEQRFSADAAHELRTPLAVLKGRIEVTRSRHRTTGEYERTLDGLAEQVERLIRLSNDLLFLARFHHSSRPVTEEVDLTWLLQSVAEQMEPLAMAKAIRFALDVEPGLAAQADTDYLIRLFINLLQNAITHTPERGTVTLKAARISSDITIKISDTGPGIPDSALPHLFRRFYRVEDDRARVSGGAGLGLAIAREIVQSHGGTIHAESELGHGTTFVVTLPLSASSPPAHHT